MSAAPGPRVPSATYRLQFNRHFTFAHAVELVDYLAGLGVTDCYASPVLTARPGSVHGYDVVDHGSVNPELGGEAELERLAERLHDRDMGLLVDVVPNHLCIAEARNPWWRDVMAHGPASPFARCFDIDWHPFKEELHGKVLLPFLGDQYGRVLEAQHIGVRYQAGAFEAVVYDWSLPLDPRTWPLILTPVADRLAAADEAHPALPELRALITALAHLPGRDATDTHLLRERRHAAPRLRERLAQAMMQPEVREALELELLHLAGVAGDPASFDALEALLAEQAYRLSFWQVASDEINYRRFFDINELAAIRVERPRVFRDAHRVLLRLVARGWVTGLRVDHPDGLFHPAHYFATLQEAAHRARQRHGAPGTPTPAATRTWTADDTPMYMVAEKILGAEEPLRPQWPVHGTTGYDFLNQVGGLFVMPEHEADFRDLYAWFGGDTQPFADLLYACKRLVLEVTLSSELQLLTHRLERISEQHRFSRDFTRNSLHDVLREVVACFPVYRTYIADGQVSAEDRVTVEFAVRAARRRNPALSEAVFGFLQQVLLLEHPRDLDAVQTAEWENFVMRFQQFTAPVMAKGMEDTAFYRAYPLAALNEVGGHPARFGLEPDAFHEWILARQHSHPHSLSATATHDTKRGEDVRARLCALSEIPGPWAQAVQRWNMLNRGVKPEVEGHPAPDRNEEYLLYQTLVGAWPPGGVGAPEWADFPDRIADYMDKALKEAKRNTSWIQPNPPRDAAVREFVHAVLRPGPHNAFLPALETFAQPVARAGRLTSLSQTVLKIAAPGVPDFYQGTELWDLSLVDPDNRRPVDFARRRDLLHEVRQRAETDLAGLLAALLGHAEDGRLKLYVIHRALGLRRTRRALFAEGTYLPLRALGERAGHVVAFARVSAEHAVVVAAGRFFMGLPPRPVDAAWGDTVLSLGHTFPAGTYRDVFTGRAVTPQQGQARLELPLCRVFGHLPVAMLERVS